MQLNPFSSWLFNVMLWGGIFALVGLSYQVFAHPFITGITALITLGVVLVLSLFWPKY
jgi:ABC-type Fe3+-siderophore transport system permease subunit